MIPLYYIYVIKLINTMIFNCSSFKKHYSCVYPTPCKCDHLKYEWLLLMLIVSRCEAFGACIQPIARRYSSSSAHNDSISSLQKSPILRKSRRLIRLIGLPPFIYNRPWVVFCRLAVSYLIYIYLYIKVPLNCTNIFLDSLSKIDGS